MSQDNKNSDPKADPKAPAETGPDGAEATPELQPAAEVELLKSQIADLTDRLLRAHAEMDNMRKRAEREREDIAKYAISRFAREVVGVGDNLQRAMGAVPEGAADQDPALKALIDGVAMTERELLNVLERHGVKRIDPRGEIFNPHQHQAMMEMENPDVAAGTILEVYQPGYLIDERVLRPAMVVVAKGGAKPAKEDRAQTGSTNGNGGPKGQAANDDAPLDNDEGNREAGPEPR